MKRNSRGNFDVSWGSGESDLFLDLTGREPRILDIEYDGEELHERCGGQTSRDESRRCFGAGYLERLGDLVPIGMYRVDLDGWQCFASVGETLDSFWGYHVRVAVPYMPHAEDKSALLRKYPTVIKADGKVVYCDFFGNFKDTMKTLLLKEELPGKAEWSSRTFSLGDVAPQEKKISLEFYDLCSMDDVPDPWKFLQDELEKFRASGRAQERMFELLSVEKLKDGTFVRTVDVAGERYQGEVLGEGDPLKTGKLTAGWRRLADDIIVRFNDRSNEVHLVAYASAQEVYEKVARRLAHEMDEGEDFISFVSNRSHLSAAYRRGKDVLINESHFTRHEYIELEYKIPKVLYVLDAVKWLAKARAELAAGVRFDVDGGVCDWLQRNAKAFSAVIPDDQLIRRRDLASCFEVDVEGFMERYFSRKTSVKAVELKAYLSDCEVAEVFRHLARRPKAR